MLRLAVIERNAVGSRMQRWFRRLLRRPIPQDIVKIMLYRPALYGGPLLALKHASFRHSTSWSEEEEELFAAFVARLKQCEICVILHALPAAGQEGAGGDAVAAALADWRSAGLRPPVAAAFRMLEALVQDTASFSAAELQELRALGVPRTAIEDLLYISSVMSIMVRIGNALGAKLDSSYAGAVRQFGLRATTPAV